MYEWIFCWSPCLEPLYWGELPNTVVDWELRVVKKSSEESRRKVQKSGTDLKIFLNVFAHDFSVLWWYWRFTRILWVKYGKLSNPIISDSLQQGEESVPFQSGHGFMECANTFPLDPFVTLQTLWNSISTIGKVALAAAWCLLLKYNKTVKNSKLSLSWSSIGVLEKFFILIVFLGFCTENELYVTKRKLQKRFN